MRNIPIPTVLTGTALVVVLVVYLVTFQVRFSEAAVKVRFGQADADSVIDGRDPNQVGLHFKWPPPIEWIRKVDIRMQVVDTPETELKTADGHNVIVGCYAIWRVKDPLQFTVRARNRQKAVEQISARVTQARSNVLGRHTLSELVNLDAELVERSHAQILKEMLEDAAPGILADYGVELIEVGIRRVSLPSEATAKVQEAMIAERDRLAKGHEQEGKALADTIRARAEAAKDSILQFAQRKAQEIESEGVKASTRILAQIPEEDQEFYLWLRWLEALETSLKSKGTIFLDWNTDLFHYFDRPFSAPAGATTASDGGGDAGQ